MPLVDSGNRTNIVFLTVCAANRQPLLAREDVHATLINAWTRANRWIVGRYVIMPDHLHLFCAPASYPEVNVRRWLEYWKFVSSRSWPRPEERPIWQLHGWDRQLRSGESYSAKWDYVRQNPVRAGLAQSADDWPHQGEMHILVWHDR